MAFPVAAFKFKSNFKMDQNGSKWISEKWTKRIKPNTTWKAKTTNLFKKCYIDTNWNYYVLLKYNVWNKMSLSYNLPR